MCEPSQKVEQRHLADAGVGGLRGLQSGHLLVHPADRLGIVEVAQVAQRARKLELRVFAYLVRVVDGRKPRADFGPEVEAQENALRDEIAKRSLK